MSEQIPAKPLEPAQPRSSYIVPWNEAYFLAAYPQFEGKLTSAQLETCWDLACLIQRNDAHSVIPYDETKHIYTRRAILYLLMCHMCTLALRPFDQAGPTTNATEGSVSVGFSVPARPDSTYFCQTPCGATYWQLLKQYALGGHYFAADDLIYHPWG